MKKKIEILMNKKTEQLGIHYSTAQNRLKVMILFMLIKKTNMNMCYRCKTEIESHNELSVDHKIRWQDNDVSLFWDLDNVAFSHKRCNSGASRYVGKRRPKHGIGDRNMEKDHYPSRRWYDVGCRCVDCREVKRLSRIKK